MKYLPAIILFLTFVKLTAISNDDSSTILRQNISSQKKPAELHDLDSLIEKIESIEEDSIWFMYNSQLGNHINQLRQNNNILQGQLLPYQAANLYYNGIYYLNKEQLPHSLNFFLRSLQIYERLGLRVKIAELQNEIGSAYNRLGDYNSALNYLKRSYEIRCTYNDTIAMAQSLNNIGTTYNSLNMTEQALKYLEQGVVLYTQMNDSLNLAGALNNIGGIYEKAGNTSLALQYYDRSFDLYNKLKNYYGLYVLNTEFGNIALKEKKYVTAERYFNNAKIQSDRLGLPATRLGLAKYLHRLYAATGRFKEAYAQQSEFQTLNDSLRNDQNRLAMMRMQAGYEYDNKEMLLKAEQEKRETIAKAEIARQKLLRNIILAITSLALVSGFFIFRFMKNKRDAEIQNKIMHLRMQAINAQMNPHFIFNCIHSIQNYIENNNLELADECLMKFAKLIRKVLDNSTREKISLTDDLEVLRDYVALEKLRLNHPLHFKINLAEELNTDDILIPPLLIQPLVENAILHGLKPLKHDGNLLIDIRGEGNSMLITVEDNGVGRQIETNSTGKRQSYGIPLTRERLHHMGMGHNQKSNYTVVDLRNENDELSGTRVTLRIPIHAL